MGVIIVSICVGCLTEPIYGWLTFGILLLLVGV